jgi:hypothetical protein
MTIARPEDFPTTSALLIKAGAKPLAIGHWLAAKAPFRNWRDRPEAGIQERQLKEDPRWTFNKEDLKARRARARMSWLYTTVLHPPGMLRQDSSGWVWGPWAGP